MKSSVAVLFAVWCVTLCAAAPSEPPSEPASEPASDHFELGKTNILYFLRHFFYGKTNRFIHYLFDASL